MALPYVYVKQVPKWINANMSFPIPLANSKLSNRNALFLKNNQRAHISYFAFVAIMICGTASFKR